VKKTTSDGAIFMVLKIHLKNFVAKKPIWAGKVKKTEK
jgi:hypothetical protein